MRSILSILLLIQINLLSAQESQIPVETYQLANGLTVYLNEDPNASNVHGAVWIHAGGKNDPADATGIAHYLEHMLFKGTQQLGTQNYALEKPHLDSIKTLYDQLAQTTDDQQKLNIQQQINQQERKASQYAIPGEFDKLVKSIGGTKVNAGTSFDYTYYYNFFPANQLSKWLDIYAERFQDPVFRLFQSELEAVYEEKNRAGDNLQRRVYEKFNEQLYGDNPYSTQQVLGSVEHLKSPSLSKMYQYFQDYYVANNMALVLSGNFNAESAKPFIEQTFGNLRSGPVPVTTPYKPSSFDGRVVEKVRITPIKAGFMGYKLVPQIHPDRPALEVIGAMMSNSNETGFIDQMNLNNEVLFAGASQDFMEEDGSTFIFYVPKVFGKSLKKFEQQIKGSLQGIAAGDFTDAYFESIKNGVYRNFSLSLEQLDSRGRYLGLSFIYGIDYTQILSFAELVQNLTKEDIQRVAAKYYGENYLAMQSRTGFPKKVKLEKPPYQPITARTEASSVYAQKFNQIPERQTKPQFIDLEKDIVLLKDYIYYTRNPLNDIFTLNLSIAGGLTKDINYPLLAAAINSSGTSKYTASELKNAFAALGASCNFSADYNAFNINLIGLDGNLEETIQLLMHVLNDFKPTDATIKYQLDQRKTDNRLTENDPPSGGRILYTYGLFGDASSYRNRISSAELKKIAPEVLKQKLESLLNNGFNTIHYIGQKEPEAVQALLSDPLFKRNRIDQYAFMESRDVSENTIYLVNDKKAIQSYIYYIVKGETLQKEDQYKKEAFNAYYTNSLSGLLFQEVREFRSLAYSTGGNFIDPIYEPEKQGRLVLFTGTQADKTANAVEVVMGLIQDMPVYESRLATVRDGLLLAASSSKPDFRSLSTTADIFLKTGYTSDPNKLNYDKYPGLTFDDIQSFYEENIQGKPVVITIYGDTSKMDKVKLGQFGRIIELDMKDIITE